MSSDPVVGRNENGDACLQQILQVLTSIGYSLLQVPRANKLWPIGTFVVIIAVQHHLESSPRNFLAQIRHQRGILVQGVHSPSISEVLRNPFALARPTKWNDRQGNRCP